MNQFVAPQFIDVEDRIVGPITTKQFVMMIGGGIVIFLASKFLDTISTILVSLFVLLVVVVFGFIKINGRSFYSFVKSMIEAQRRPKVRVWYKQVPISTLSKKSSSDKDKEVRTEFVPSREKLKAKHLSDLALIVDTGGKYRG